MFWLRDIQTGSLISRCHSLCRQYRIQVLCTTVLFFSCFPSGRKDRTSQTVTLLLSSSASSEMIRVCTPECLRTQTDVRVSIKGSCGWLITAIVAFVCMTISDANSPIMTNSNRRHRRQNLQLGNFDIDIARRNILHRDHSYDVAIPTKRSKMNPNLDMEEEDLPHRSKIWPPWPFNLIGNNKKSQKQRSDDGYPSTGALFWTYLRHRSRIGVRQLQQRKFLDGNELSYASKHQGSSLVSTDMMLHMNLQQSEVSFGSIYLQRAHHYWSWHPFR